MVGPQPPTDGQFLPRQSTGVCQMINLEECPMKWVTPAAKVLRFGMEINSYVANR